MGVLRGDFGKSLVSGRSVSEILAPRIFNTVFLSIYAFLIYLPLATFPALAPGVRRDRPVDHAFSVITLVLLSMPDFLLATLLLSASSSSFPCLPAMSLVDQTSALCGIPARHDAAGDHAGHRHGRRRRAHAARQPDRGARFRLCPHGGAARACRAAACCCAMPCPMRWLPTLNVTALNLAYLIGGVVIVEKVFAYPGFGSLLVDSPAAARRAADRGDRPDLGAASISPPTARRHRRDPAQSPSCRTG